MSSRKLSDKEFDRYTRNILKKPEDIAFDESAWASMEQRMAQEATSSSISGLKWLIPATILFISSLGYLGYQGVFSTTENTGTPKIENIDTNTEKSTIVDNTAPSESINDPKNESASIAKVSHDENTVKTNNSKPQQTEQLNTEMTSLPSSVSSQTQTNPNKNDPTIKPVENSTSKVEEPAVVTESKSGTTLNTVSDTNTQEAGDAPTEQVVNTTAPVSPEPTNITETSLEPRNPTTTSTTQKPEEEEEEVIYSDDLLNPYPINSKRPIVVLANLEDPMAFLTPQGSGQSERPLINSEDDDEKEELPTPFNRWSFGVTLAPDFTTVGQLSEFTKPGIDFGISAEYFILRRLSITTGAILTRKLYNTTDLSEYTIPAGFWNGNDGPNEIAANCKVIDIPLNIRYRLREGTRTSLFVSAGISSYLMLTERYDYNYDYGTVGNGNRPEGWEVANENNHFFGVYNLSVGINRRVTDKISIEAEPFLKNSLGGVGWGQVRLKSTGILFHIKYSF